MKTDLVMAEVEKLRAEMERMKGVKTKTRKRELPKITQEVGVIGGLGNGKYVVTLDDVGEKKGVHIAKKAITANGNEIFLPNNLILPRTKEAKEILMKAFKGV